MSAADAYDKAYRDAIAFGYTEAEAAEEGAKASRLFAEEALWNAREDKWFSLADWLYERNRDEGVAA